MASADHRSLAGPVVDTVQARPQARRWRLRQAGRVARVQVAAERRVRTATHPRWAPEAATVTAHAAAKAVAVVDAATSVWPVPVLMAVPVARMAAVVVAVDRRTLQA
jgi:hypothetical protein